MWGVGWRDLTVRPGGGGGGPGTGLAAIAVVVNLPGRDVWRVIRWRDCSVLSLLTTSSTLSSPPEPAGRWDEDNVIVSRTRDNCSNYNHKMSELNIFNGPQTASGWYTTGTYWVSSGTKSSDWSQLRRGGEGEGGLRPPAQLGSILRLFWKVFNVINTEQPLNHINNNLE